MKKYLLILIGLSICNPLFGQREILEKYPFGQHYYAGGINEFNKEMVKFVKELNLLPCDVNEERYIVPIIVNEDASINYIKDFDSIDIKKNQCAFDYSRKLLPKLKKWTPARENGNPIAAIVKIEIKPFYLYNSKEDLQKNQIKTPIYKQGQERFKTDIKSIFQRWIKTNEDKKSELIFVVNENGEMEDFKIEGGYTEREKGLIGKELSRIKGKWNPATFNGIPIKYRLRLPIVQNFDLRVLMEDYKSKTNNQSLYDPRKQ